MMILGLLAATLTTISFVPQVIRTWKLKKTDEISLGMYLLFCSGVLLWFIYGWMIKDTPVMLANGLTLILASIILFFKLKYG